MPPRPVDAIKRRAGHSWALYSIQLAIIGELYLVPRLGGYFAPEWHEFYRRRGFVITTSVEQLRCNKKKKRNAPIVYMKWSFSRAVLYRALANGRNVLYVIVIYPT